jgi:hypothetical protein
MLGLLRVAVVAAILVPGAAAGELQESDLAAIGDGLVTFDTETSLIWLDLTETAGLTFDEVVADADGWIGNGWSHADAGQVCDLFMKLGAKPTPCPGNTAIIPGYAVIDHHTLLGLTLDDGNNLGTAGLYDDGAPADGVGAGIANYQVAIASSDLFVADNLVPPNAPSATSGHFLIRVPEPAPLLSFTLGVFGLALIDRFRRSSRRAAC